MPLEHSSPQGGLKGHSLPSTDVVGQQGAVHLSSSSPPHTHLLHPHWNQRPKWICNLLTFVINMK